MLTDMKTWTERFGHSKPRAFTDKDNHFGLEQNQYKNLKWAKLAREGHEIAWDFEAQGAHTPAACSSMAKCTRRAKRRRNS